MILNETYDTILERLNNKYGITSINEGLFGNSAKIKKFCLELKENYDKWIKHPDFINYYWFFVIIKWNMNTKQFINFYTKNNIHIENFYGNGSYGWFDEPDKIYGKYPNSGWCLYYNDEMLICIGKDKKLYQFELVNYDDPEEMQNYEIKVKQITLENDIEDYIRFNSFKKITKKEYFNYINE